jgi:hypothetical protein
MGVWAAVQVNQTLHVYYRFLERRAALLGVSEAEPPRQPQRPDDADGSGTEDDIPGSDGGPDVHGIELFLCSELQRNQELHSALALTAEPAEVRPPPPAPPHGTP